MNTRDLAFYASLICGNIWFASDTPEFGWLWYIVVAVLLLIELFKKRSELFKKRTIAMCEYQKLSEEFKQLKEAHDALVMRHEVVKKDLADYRRNG